MGFIVKSYKKIVQIFTFKPSIHKYTRYLTPLQNNIIIILYLYVHENRINYFYIFLAVKTIQSLAHYAIFKVCFYVVYKYLMEWISSITN